MPDSDPITLGEVYRRLTAIEQLIRDTSRDYVHVDRYLAERQATGERIGVLEADVGEIRGDTKWLRRTILLAVTGFVVNILVGIAVLLIGVGIRG